MESTPTWSIFLIRHSLLHSILAACPVKLHLEFQIKSTFNPLFHVSIGAAVFFPGHRRPGSLQVQQCHSAQILHPG